MSEELTYQRKVQHKLDKELRRIISTHSIGLNTTEVMGVLETLKIDIFIDWKNWAKKNE